MRSIHGGKGGDRRGSIPQRDSIAVRPLGDAGDRQRAALAAKLLGQLVSLMSTRGARPEGAMLTLTYSHGPITLLIAANTADQAAGVISAANERLQAAIAIMMSEPPASGTSVTEPAPAPCVDDTGPQTSDPGFADETSNGPESSDP